MIIKLASVTSNVVERLGLTNFSKKLAKNPELANKIKNASLVGTIALGDGAVKAADPHNQGHRIKAFGRGAAEGAFAGGLIAGADQLVDTMASHGASKLNMFGR